MPHFILLSPYRPDINKESNAVVLLELTCSFDSVCQLESAGSRKIEKEDYQLLSPWYC